MDSQPEMITTEQAAQVAHEYGLSDLDGVWWNRQIDRHHFSAVVIARRRRLLKEHVIGFLETKVATLRAQPPSTN